MAIALCGCTQPPGGQPAPDGGTGGWGERPGEQGGPGSNQPPGGDELVLPPINTDAPLPELLAGVSKGEWKTASLGDVEIKYFSTAIIRGLTESGTDYFITLKNNGSSEATVNFLTAKQLAGQIPAWNLHFFDFQDPPVKIAPENEEKLWYYASIDSSSEEPFTVNFKLWLGNDSRNAVELPIIFGGIEETFWGKETSLVYGYVKDESGKPVENVIVDVIMNCGRVNFSGESDERGAYFAKVLAMEDINAIYLGKELACDSTDYYVSVAADGYEYYFKEHVAPTRNEFVRLDIVLEKKKENVSYSLNGRKKSRTITGFSGLSLQAIGAFSPQHRQSTRLSLESLRISICLTAAETSCGSRQRATSAGA